MSIHRSCKSQFLEVALTAAIGLLLVCPAARAQQAITSNDALRHRVEALAKPPGRTVDGWQVAAPEVIAKIYAALNFQLAWSNVADVNALKAAVARSWEDGLQPRDFHATALAGQASGTEPAASAAVERDIAMTDVLVRLLYQLYFGKVRPNSLDPDWNLSRPVLSGDPVAIITAALQQGKVGDLIERARLTHPLYTALKAQLQRYTQLDVAGGWPQVPPGPVLKPGAQEPRIPALRARLSVTGEYEPAGETSSDVFDDKLVAAVKRFQSEHGLEDDGVLGAEAVKELNVAARQRIDQIRVNLERARWILRSLGPDMLVVNIAGFYLRVVLDGKPVWGTRVIVGQTYHKTPIFTEMMKHVVFNPDWTVPRSIVRNELFPKAAANPGYLVTNNYRLKDGSGTIVDAAAIDWSQWTAPTFPYSVVQQPGPNNALGKVKFLFPNKYSVYLHDTPRRDLFGKSGRTFSHGCIRVEDPIKLAEVILGNQLGWKREEIDSVVAAGKLRQVALPKPLPVLLLYWTVDPGFDGSARFYRDIYGRDARLLKALDAEFSVSRN